MVYILKSGFVKNRAAFFVPTIFFSSLKNPKIIPTFVQEATLYVQK